MATSRHARVAQSRAVPLATAVSVTHFAATFLALRTVIAATAEGVGRSALLHAGVAVLAFPLFYTPAPGLFGGRPHTGTYLAALNALLWGVVAWAVARRAMLRQSLATSQGG